MRALRLGIAAAAAVALAACGVPAPLLKSQPSDRPPVRSVAVLPSTDEPELQLPDVAQGPLSAAGRVGGSVAAGCMLQGLAGAGTCTASGPFAGICAAVPLLIAALCGVAAAGGAAASAATAPSASAVEHNLHSMRQALRERGVLQRLLAEGVAERARTLGTPATVLAADTAPPRRPADDELQIRTRVTRIGLAGSGVDPPLALLLQAQAGVGEAGSGDQLFSVQTGHRRLAAWVAEGGDALARQLQSAYRRLGAHIYEQLVLLYDPPGTALGSAGVLAFAFGLAPEHPRMTGTTPTGTPLLSRLALEWPAVDAQPTLRWQSFPRPEHVAATPGLAGRLADIRYDLVIARAEALGPGDIVYERSGLPAPVHTLEQPLERGGRYYWTVRAHFVLDGRDRVGEWGTTAAFARRTQAVPNAYSYRFAVRH